jgi:putative ABC transport system permease protein
MYTHHLEGEKTLLFHEFSHAARMMRRTPLFTATVVLTVALAIAANTTIFSVVNAVMLKPFHSESPTDSFKLRKRTIS